MARDGSWRRSIVAAGVFAAVVVAVVGALRGGAKPERHDDGEPGFDNPGRAMEWVLLAHRDEFGNIPREGLMRARAHVDRMRSVGKGAADEEMAMDAAGISRGSWTWVGPNNIGGRVRAIVINPSNPNTIIAGGVAGGIWKSTNGGSTWRLIDDFMGNLAISTIVMRPGEPNRLFAGTGEGFFNADSIRGAGIFTSTDEGETWSQIPSTATVDFDFVNRLAFSRDGAVLLAATRT